MIDASARSHVLPLGFSVLLHALLLVLLILRLDSTSAVRAPNQPETIQAHVVDSAGFPPHRRSPAGPTEPAVSASPTPPEAAGERLRMAEEPAPATRAPEARREAPDSRVAEEVLQRKLEREREEAERTRRLAIEQDAARSAARAEADRQARAESERVARARREAAAAAEAAKALKAEQDAAAQTQREARTRADRVARAKAESEARAKADQAARERAARDAAARVKAEAEAQAAEEKAAATRAAEQRRAAEAQRQQAQQESKERAERMARTKAEADAQAKAAQAGAEAELRRKLDQEMQEKAAAEAHRQQQERERALKEQLAQESEAGDDGRVEDEAQQWASRKIKPRIKARWVRPPSAVGGMSCRMRVSTDPSGHVTGVALGSCSGDADFARSAEAAVMKASPLPMPPDPRVSAKLRSFQITFQPE